MSETLEGKELEQAIDHSTAQPRDHRLGGLGVVPAEVERAAEDAAEVDAEALETLDGEEQMVFLTLTPRWWKSGTDLQRAAGIIKALAILSVFEIRATAQHLMVRVVVRKGEEQSLSTLRADVLAQVEAAGGYPPA